MQLIKSLMTFVTASTLLSASAGPNTVFFDDFTGPVLSSLWQPSLPDAKFAGPFLGQTYTAVYKGAADANFTTLDGDSMLRMSSLQSPLERRGWRSSTPITSPDFRYEVRFNTLLQSSATSIDGFLEVWVLDAADSSRYDMVNFWGGDTSTTRKFFSGSSIDNSFQSQSLAYQNNTYYRYVIEGSSTQNVRLSVQTDEGAEIFGRNLNHNASAFSSGFYVVMSQSIGVPYSAYPNDVAIDFARVTVVPEPGTGLLAGIAFVILIATRRNRA